MNLKKTFGKFQFNDLVGIAVLGIGALAILFVGYLIYKKFNPSNTINNIEKNEMELYKQSSNINNRANDNVLPVKKAYVRQRSISDKQMAGTWGANIDNEMALLEMGKGKYKLVIIPSQESKIRYYSNGNYTIQGDVILLEPDLSIPSPASKTFEYSVLTQSSMPVMVGIYDGKIVWQPPSPDVNIYVPPYHPVLSRSDNQIVVWSVLK